MEYRCSFFAGLFANFYCYFITYTTFWVITQQFQTIDGWAFDDMVILYGLNLFTYSVAATFFWYNVLHLEQEITSGRLDGYLIRPMGLLQQLVCSRFGDTALGQISVSLIFISLCIVRINYKMTIFTYIYLFFAVIGGVLMQMGAMIIFGSLSFWMLRSKALADIIYFDFRTFVHYPLSIFPSFIRIILTYVLPWAIINYYPSLIILQKVHTTEEFVLGILSPIIGILFFMLSLSVFNRGLRRYSGSGS